MYKTISVDREGYFKSSDGLRISDAELGKLWLESLEVNDKGVCSLTYEGEYIVVEPFDKPYVAQQVYTESGLEILLPYELRCKVKLESLCLDPWDRFHGLTEKGIPFVLTSKAQAELFQLADGFSDDSITIAHREIDTDPFYKNDQPIHDNEFWSAKYAAEEKPGWDLEGPHPALESVLPQIKLLKGRFLVPGCGRGHDAAALAEKGHIVTGLDFSARAVEEATKLYSQVPRLTFEQADVLNLPESYNRSVDFIFEHTCFCAIPTSQRKNLVKTWARRLDERGHLLGVFFLHTRRGGPPYGCSEWELERLMEPYFDIRYWTRSQVSPGWRKGIELIVYAEKKRDIF